MAEWLATEGHDVGARTPNVAERARACGLPDYCQALLDHGLNAEQLFSAQGNAFDVDAFRTRCQGPILDWLRGAALPAADLLHPAALREHYSALATRLAEAPGLREHVAVTPGPAWLWDDFCNAFAAQAAADAG